MLPYEFTSVWPSIFYFYQSKGRIIIPLYSHLETFYDELKYFRLVNYIIEDPKCDVFILYKSFADLQDTFKHDPVRLQELKTKYKKVIFFSENRHRRKWLTLN